MVEVTTETGQLLEISEKNYDILAEKLDKLLEGKVKLELTTRLINLHDLKDEEGVAMALWP